MTSILVAGGTGDLGSRVVRELLVLGADVRVLTRPAGGASARDRLGPDVEVVEAAYDDPAALGRACEGVDVVVSTLSGVRSVIVDAQTALLDAAVAAGVPRFVPSDYSVDPRDVPVGSNRNLELRREFWRRVDASPIRATSVLCGAFADLLTGQAPIVLFDRHAVLFWGDADQRLDFTTKDDVAVVTAAAALDDRAPRVVEVAGDTVTPRDLATIMTELTGRRHRLVPAGTPGLLGAVARVMRAASTETDEPFPVWQGMQYLVTMASGVGLLRHVGNDRYGVRPWTSARDVLAEHLAA